MTTPAAETKSIGLPAYAQLSWFLLPIAIGSHLDSFIVTGQLAAFYRDSAIWTTSSGRDNFHRLPVPIAIGIAKTSSATTQTATQFVAVNKP